MAFRGGALAIVKPMNIKNNITCLMAIDSQEVCLKCDLQLDDWIVDSGCTKHMTGNRRLFTSYKAYDGGHVVFGSNLKGKTTLQSHVLHTQMSSAALHYSPPQDEHHHEDHPDLLALFSIIYRQFLEFLSIRRYEISMNPRRSNWCGGMVYS
ncbi:hypothetical protein Tco_0764057 [Tanacetum coccineum]